MDLIESLSFFVRIVEKRGVAVAGRDLGISAAASSDRLAMLEAHYGAKLLHRTTRSLSLTEEGRTLLDSARQLISEAHTIEQRIKHGVTRLSGTIKVSASNDLGQRQIAPLLDTFIALHPDVSVELILDDNQINIVHRGIDLAIRLGSLKSSTLIARKLGDNRRVICAAPRYLERYGVPEHPNDLTHHNCLIMQFGRIIDNEWAFTINQRQSRYVVTGNRVSNNGYQVYRWCLDGYGLALKSLWDVRTDLKHGDLVEVLEKFTPQDYSALQLVYPDGGKIPQRVRALIDFLVDHFQRDNATINEEN